MKVGCSGSSEVRSANARSDALAGFRNDSRNQPCPPRRYESTPTIHSHPFSRLFLPCGFF